MEQINMTALFSCYVRAYHFKNNKYRIYNDSFSENIISDEEYNNISTNLINGIKFFNTDFTGSAKEGLRYIVDNQLSPSVLVRSKFNEELLNNEIKFGTKQYLVLASGYDTSSYQLKAKIQVFEVDIANVIDDKINRLDRSNINHHHVNFIKCNFNEDNLINYIMQSTYNPKLKTFCSILGISYYLPKKSFESLLQSVSSIIPDGSAIVFDYPDDTYSKEKNLNQKLAKESKNEMLSQYSYNELEQMSSKYDLLIYKHLNYQEANNEILYNYNTLNPSHRIYAPIGINYCMLVKKAINK